MLIIFQFFESFGHVASAVVRCIETHEASFQAPFEIRMHVPLIHVLLLLAIAGTMIEF